MRQVRAKSLRRAHPDRPHPGRKYGGSAGKEHANDTMRQGVGRTRRRFTMKNLRKNDGN